MWPLVVWLGWLRLLVASRTASFIAALVGRKVWVRVSLAGLRQ